MGRHSVIPFSELAKNAGEVYRATRREPPLACVLLSVSYLERLLITVLSNFLIKAPTSKQLFDPNNGSLGQFSSCSDLAYCLGLIAKDVHTNLRIVGKIRNAFAHSDVQMDFDNQRIKDFCKSLTPPIVLDQNGNEATFQIDKYGKTTRDRFSTVVTVLVHQLSFAIARVRCCTDYLFSHAHWKPRRQANSQRGEDGAAKL